MWELSATASHCMPSGNRAVIPTDSDTELPDLVSESSSGLIGEAGIPDIESDLLSAVWDQAIVRNLVTVGEVQYWRQVIEEPELSEQFAGNSESNTPVEGTFVDRVVQAQRRAHRAREELITARHKVNWFTDCVLSPSTPDLLEWNIYTSQLVIAGRELQEAVLAFKQQFNSLVIAVVELNQAVANRDPTVVQSDSNSVDG